MDSLLPLVTVLMPVYNGERYLFSAIESILNQTFQDFELLIVDDCSNDNSIKIIESFSNKKINLIRNNKNQGQSATMNRGLKLSKGKYIARLDQDDLSYKERLQIQIEKISDSEISTFTNKLEEIKVITGEFMVTISPTSTSSAEIVPSASALSCLFCNAFCASETFAL